MNKCLDLGLFIFRFNNDRIFLLKKKKQDDYLYLFLKMCAPIFKCASSFSFSILKDVSLIFYNLVVGLLNTVCGLLPIS